MTSQSDIAAPMGGNNSTNLIDLRPLDLDQVDCTYIDSYSKEMDSCISKNDVSLLQLNIRGLYGKQDELHRLLNKMGGSNKVDIISLNETWLRKETTNKVKINGYQIINKVWCGKKGGGVSILLRDGLKYRRRNELESKNPILENIILEIKTHCSSLLICSAYRAPNTKIKEFLEEYNVLLEKLVGTKNKNVLIAMDHNLDLLKTDQHQETLDFVMHNIDNDIYPCITKPTRVTHSSATLIDNIFASEKLHRNSTNYIIQDDISDHYPCLTVMPDMSELVQTERIIYTRSIKEKNLNAVRSDLSEVDWIKVLSDMTCNDAFDKFHEFTITSLNKHCPETVKRVKGKRKRHDPWITSGILRSIAKQKKLYAKTKHVASSSVNEYKSYKATLQRIIRKSKENYFLKKCSEYKTNARKMWSMINTVIKKESNKLLIIDGLKVDNLLVTNESQIAKEFGKYFANIGKNCAKEIPNPKNNIEHYLAKIAHEPTSIYLTPATEREVEVLILKLQPKSSSGHDNLSNKLLKDLSHVVIKPLTIIINKSLSEGVFPTNMKKADVSPLFKSKCKKEKSNYRPISLLLTLSKILEKIMYKRTYNYLNSRDIIYKSQYGFRSNHSCELATCELVGEIIKGQENKQQTIAVYLDLSKAFDTLNHSILLAKMERYGIRGLALQWYSSYLSNRQLRSKINLEQSNRPLCSEYYPIEYGTPQGSCLGPLLFLVFTNDLYHNLTFCKCILFADDTTVFYTHENLTFLHACIEIDLQVLDDWFKANSLTLNLNKSRVMTFGHHNKKAQCPIKIGTVTLPEATEFKFLGTWIDKDLNWKHHVNQLQLKINRNLHMLRMGKKFLSRSALLSVYYAHIYSHLTYGILLWGNMASKTQLNRLQKIQNKCITAITNKKSM